MIQHNTIQVYSIFQFQSRCLTNFSHHSPFSNNNFDLILFLCRVVCRILCFFLFCTLSDRQQKLLHEKKKWKSLFLNQSYSLLMKKCPTRLQLLTNKNIFVFNTIPNMQMWRCLVSWIFFVYMICGTILGDVA